ncbi:MAG TPA: DUF695 domain-containing protein [Sulfuricurvum sp.]|nr:DUF695 domain-containing protein [Sulfuricurvum sp.]
MKITYTAQNEEHRPVEIEANLDFGERADDTVWMLWAFAPLQASGETAEYSERERLEKIVIELETSLERSNGAVYAGMRTLDGWAEFYFYAVFSKGAEKYFRQIFHSHGYPQIEFGVNRDTEQRFFHEQLSPNVYQLQQANSRQIIEELEAAGDALESVRPVEHYLFFQTRSAMERTAESLWSQGRVDTDREGEEPFPYALVLELDHACTLNAVEAVVAPLIDAASRAHGRYVGWSTALADEAKE